MLLSFYWQRTTGRLVQNWKRNNRPLGPWHCREGAGVLAAHSSCSGTTTATALILLQQLQRGHLDMAPPPSTSGI